MARHQRPRRDGAPRLRQYPYKAAGKSGTAQVVGLKENQVYNAATTKVEHRDNALFVAFAPSEAPKAVVALVLENAGAAAPWRHRSPATCWMPICCRRNPSCHRHRKSRPNRVRSFPNE